MYTTQKFIESKKIITDQKEIETFLTTYGSEYDSDYLYTSVHVYADSYFIFEEKDGSFLCEIENEFRRGTLAECEIYLWEYAEGELNS